MKKIFRIFYSLLAPLLFPATALAQERWNIWRDTTCAPGGGGPTEPCSACDALVVIRNIIDILFEVALLFGIIMVAFGAIYLMVAGASEKGVSKGRKIITMAVVGVVIAILAWVIVNTIISMITPGGFNWREISC